MPWFKVDDTLPFHAKVVAAGNAAMGLWVRAGAWSMQQLTEGFVPDHIVGTIGTEAQAKRLVAVKLWTRSHGGYQFWEWSDDGRQPTKEHVQQERAAAKERQRRARERAKEQRDAEKQSRGSHAVTHAVTSGEVTVPPTRPDPTRPDPSLSRTTSGCASSSTANPRRCTEHAHIPDDVDVPNCRGCMNARLRGERQLADEQTAQRDDLAAARNARSKCLHCDPDGWVLDPDTQRPLRRCDHGKATA